MKLKDAKVSPLREERPKWTVHSKIEKYNTEEALKAGTPDEVLNLPANCLCNDGVNLLWSLVAGDSTKGNAFDATHAHIGVGNCNGTAVIPTAGDTGLTASVKKLYMKMDDGYPIYGQNQKIVFRSTYAPGCACFEWLEWTIANGNGNQVTGAWDTDVIRTTAQGTDPEPSPIPVQGTQFDLGVGEANIVNLNHKQENMGQKYASATWIVSVEISLS